MAIVTRMRMDPETLAYVELTCCGVFGQRIGLFS